jgi:hypothetical protein
LLKVHGIGKVILDVVHDPIHPRGVLPARGCRGCYRHANTLTVQSGVAGQGTSPARLGSNLSTRGEKK